ncbi:hypothetical protein BT63DRAFT_438632 [Microthyrium microscopicum]|uniref:Uncharacterized protein n=1 Tax=Microthyrium microscopicum TaxID=703497 RepID=A0A6A6UFP0_9PEZI|nr:hypothetical protein BT63DRAFT_438632 [Microthyrium microscopicum]
MPVINWDAKPWFPLTTEENVPTKRSRYEHAPNHAEDTEHSGYPNKLARTEDIAQSIEEIDRDVKPPIGLHHSPYASSSASGPPSTPASSSPHTSLPRLLSGNSHSDRRERDESTGSRQTTRTTETDTPATTYNESHRPSLAFLRRHDFHGNSNGNGNSWYLSPSDFPKVPPRHISNSPESDDFQSKPAPIRSFTVSVAPGRSITKTEFATGGLVVRNYSQGLARDSESSALDSGTEWNDTGSSDCADSDSGAKSDNESNKSTTHSNSDELFLYNPEAARYWCPEVNTQDIQLCLLHRPETQMITQRANLVPKGCELNLNGHGVIGMLVGVWIPKEHKTVNHFSNLNEGRDPDTENRSINALIEDKSFVFKEQAHTHMTFRVYMLLHGSKDRIKLYAACNPNFEGICELYKVNVPEVFFTRQFADMATTATTTRWGGWAKDIKVTATQVLREYRNQGNRITATLRQQQTSAILRDFGQLLWKSHEFDLPAAGQFVFRFLQKYPDINDTYDTVNRFAVYKLGKAIRRFNHTIQMDQLKNFVVVWGRLIYLRKSPWNLHELLIRTEEVISEIEEAPKDAK